MYATNPHESTPGSDLKRKHGKGSRGSARRVRETMFFRLLTEEDSGSSESGLAASGLGLIPAWLSVSLQSS